MIRKLRRPAALTLVAAQLLTACFRYVPATVDPVAGARIALEINDAGRVALTSALGPGVIRVEGTLVGIEGDALVVDAMMVTQLRLRPTSVDSVRVRVAKSHIVLTEERKLSKRRTFALVGAAVVGVVSFFVTKGWFGRSTPPDGGTPGGPDQ